jgi:hypothetical protein
MFAALEILSDSEDFNMAWEIIQENIKISAKSILDMDRRSINYGLINKVHNF